MHYHNRIRFSVVPLALFAVVAAAGAQGQGRGQGSDKPKASQGGNRADAPRGADRAKPAQARDQNAANRNANKGRDDAARAARETVRDRNSASAPNPNARAVERANSNARFKRSWSNNEVRSDLRRFISSDRPSQFLTAGALAHAHARKVRDNAFVMTPSGQQMLVKNRKGDVLVALDDDRARNLGGWKVRPLNDEVREGAPSFCRSGAGHPNWGRQWCVDKGFGIGTENDVRWGRNQDMNDVRFLTEPTSSTLTRAALAAVLGERAVDRLAVHAITLGLVDPLVGTWRADPNGERVLLVNSGNHPVAEIVDVNRDNRGDRMMVALRPW